MDREDRNEEEEAYVGPLNGTGADSDDRPQISGRMKHLLFGVRLSVVSAPLEPAGDLDALAHRLDAMRESRQDGSNS